MTSSPSQNTEHRKRPAAAESSTSKRFRGENHPTDSATDHGVVSGQITAVQHPPSATTMDDIAQWLSEAHNRIVSLPALPASLPPKTIAPVPTSKVRNASPPPAPLPSSAKPLTSHTSRQPFWEQPVAISSAAKTTVPDPNEAPESSTKQLDPLTMVNNHLNRLCAFRDIESGRNDKILETLSDLSTLFSQNIHARWAELISKDKIMNDLLECVKLELQPHEEKQSQLTSLQSELSETKKELKECRQQLGSLMEENTRLKDTQRGNLGEVESLKGQLESSRQLWLDIMAEREKLRDAAATAKSQHTQGKSIHEKEIARLEGLIADGLQAVKWLYTDIIVYCKDIRRLGSIIEAHGQPIGVSYYDHIQPNESLTSFRHNPVRPFPPKASESRSSVSESKAAEATVELPSGSQTEPGPST